jgi:hypothetical protein
MLLSLSIGFLWSRGPAFFESVIPLARVDDKRTGMFFTFGDGGDLPHCEPFPVAVLGGSCDTPRT